ncbi:hypothetical protein ABKV19_017406 [Rosa sericea]
MIMQSKIILSALTSFYSRNFPKTKVHGPHTWYSLTKWADSITPVYELNDRIPIQGTLYFLPEPGSLIL